MLMRQRSTGHILAVLDLEHLCNAFHEDVLARDQVGEEEQDPEPVPKDDLAFLSGEPLPRCWTDPDYRDDEIAHQGATVRANEALSALRDGQLSGAAVLVP